MVRVEELPAGWLTRFRRGVVCGAATVGIACLVAAVPTLLAWFAPGADSTSALAAVKIAVLLAVTSNRGGLAVDGTLVTLTPLLGTAVLAWLVATQARKPETGGAFAGFVIGYTLTCGLATHWAVVGTTHAQALPTMLAALVLSVGVGVLARWGPAAWRRLGAAWRAVGQASLAAVAVYLLLAAVLDAAMLAAHFSAAMRLQSELAFGAAGFPVALIGIAGVPNVIVATTGYLAGPGFAVGTHTHVSLSGVHRGDLPVFPLLAGLPAGGGSRDIGIGLCIGTAVVAGAVITRILLSAGATRGDAVGARLAQLAAASVSAGACLGLLAAVGGGNLGSSAMHGVGAPALPLAGAVAAALTASSITVYLGSEGVAWVLHRRDFKPAGSPVLNASERPVELDANDTIAPAAAADTAASPTSSAPATDTEVAAADAVGQKPDAVVQKPDAIVEQQQGNDIQQDVPPLGRTG